MVIQIQSKVQNQIFEQPKFSYIYGMIIKQKTFIKYVLTIAFLHLLYVSDAQEKFTDDLVIGGNYQFGLLVPEYSIVSYTTTNHAQSFDLAIYKEKKGNDIYEQIFGYPEMGLALFYSTLGNSEVYGKAFAANYFYRINLFSGRNFRIFNRMGIGLGYLTKKFDLDKNHLNVAIGSSINIHYNVRFGSSFQLTDRFSMNAGLSFDHYSNGNTGYPNIGLNYLTAYSGVNYLIGEKTERIESEIPDYERGHSFEVLASLGAKYTRSFLAKYYPTYSAAFEYNYLIGRTFNFGTGLDVFYDTSVIPQLEEAGEETRVTDNFQTGIHLSQTIVYRNFRFSLQEGFYIGLANRVNNKAMYSRAILKYFVNDNFSLRFALKSHLHILDYPEIGFGYKF
tara:strand:+ start:6024 stop:7202 length:1179 start_codon:yes stop_codon:yes gene_type:complete